MVKLSQKIILHIILRFLKAMIQYRPNELILSFL